MSKVWFVVGGVVGYVLGARAGRQAYEKLKGRAADVWASSPVQKGVDSAEGYARDRIPVVGDKVADAIGTASKKAGAAASSASTNG